MSGTGPLPLAGCRVLDLTTHAAGPWATQILAFLGATVVKVERPPGGDPERTTEPPMFHACNQGKQSIVLDLSSAPDREVVLQLAHECDVFVENFRPGVADRLGLGFDAVAASSPSVIYVSFSGYGSSGPYANRRAYDVEMRALAGELYLNRDADGVPQYAPAVPIFNFATGQYAVIGVLAAMREPGHGAVLLEAPILAAGLTWSFPGLTEFLSGERHRWVYRASDDKYLTITTPVPESFRALCDAVGRPELADGGRTPAALDAITDAITTRTRDEWLAVFGAAGIASAPVLTSDEVFVDPGVRHLDVIGLEPSPWMRMPVSGIRTASLAAPPALDEHGDAIRARGWAGADDSSKS